MALSPFLGSYPAMPQAKMRTFRHRQWHLAAIDPIITRPNRPAKGKAWSEEQMAEAMECVTSLGTTTINKAAELYVVPKTTI